MRDALLLFAEEKSESEGESQYREESINRNDRIDIAIVALSVLFFLSFKSRGKKAKKKPKRNPGSSSIDRERRRRRRRENVPWQKGQRKITVGVRNAREENAWSVSRPRGARAFSKSTKNFSYPKRREGTRESRSFPLSNPSRITSTEKKEPRGAFRKRPSNARARRPRDARERRISLENTRRVGY